MISVVIPVLNEEKYIKKCINSIRNSESRSCQIIVIDAGSTDRTCNIVRQIPDVKLIEAPGFRGKKFAALNYAAGIATGQILLFLDADTLVPWSFDTLIRKKISEGFAGGAFHMSFDKSGFLLKIIEKANQVRYRITLRFFGDQAIFCTASAFKKAGGFPPMTIMQDTHFCSQLKKAGRLGLIQQKVISSSRRFDQNGILAAFLFDLKIYLRDLLGLDVSLLGDKYWKQNEHQQDSVNQ